MPFAVERAEVEAYQRHTENARGGARREAFAATLDTQEQNALRRIQLGRIAVESRLAAGQPGAQALHSADIGKFRRLRLVREGAAAIEKLIFGGQHALQIRHRKRAVVEDRLTDETLRIGGSQPAQVVNEL